MHIYRQRGKSGATECNLCPRIQSSSSDASQTIGLEPSDCSYIDGTPNHLATGGLFTEVRHSLLAEVEDLVQNSGLVDMRRNTCCTGHIIGGFEGEKPFGFVWELRAREGGKCGEGVARNFSSTLKKFICMVNHASQDQEQDSIHIIPILSSF